HAATDQYDFWLWWEGCATVQSLLHGWGERHPGFRFLYDFAFRGDCQFRHAGDNLHRSQSNRLQRTSAPATDYRPGGDLFPYAPRRRLANSDEFGLSNPYRRPREHGCL